MRSVTPKIVYSDSAGSDSNNETVGVSSQDSPRGLYIDIQGSPIEIDDNSSDPHTTSQNLSSSPKDSSSSSPESNEGFVTRENMIAARQHLHLHGLRIVEPKKSKRGINQATLAQAALSAVLETEETPSLEQWFEGESKGSLSRERRSSSFDDILVIRRKEPDQQINCAEMSSKPSTLPRSKNSENITRTIVSLANTSINAENRPIVSDYELKKARGHTRSKSDQIRTTRIGKELLTKEPEIKKEHSTSLGEPPKLSTSLPASSG